MNFSNNTTFHISDNIVYRKQPDGNFVLLEIEGDSLFHLDDVSAFVWDLIAEKNDYKSLVKKINDEFEDMDSKKMGEVNEFINELILKKILSVRE